MRLIACAYRSWAVRVVAILRELFPEHSFAQADSPDALGLVLAKEGLPDAVLAIGWSWRFDRAIVDATWIVGIHPSDLPDFAGGSPIQNQILAGVTRTMNTLFRITNELDAGPILGKVPLQLDGHMDQIFERLTQTSTILLVDFIRAFPDGLNPIPQVARGAVLRRLKSDSGRLGAADFAAMTTRQLYDAIRCREDPYPNAYIQDDVGRLLFKRADFEEKP